MEESRNRSEVPRKPRVLCLHGFQTSGKILEDQIRSRWPVSVVGELDLVFPNAPFAAAEAVPGLDGVVYEWFQYSQDLKDFYKFEECIDFLECYMSEHGPFDGILGFSQGAFLAASLPGIQNNGGQLTNISGIKFFILISGGRFGHIRFGTPRLAIDAYAYPIDCPSLHIIGEGDIYVTRDESEALLSCFVDPIVIYHPQGHVIPQLTGESLQKTLAFVQTIQTNMEQ